jgi:hypothetical protein
MVTLELWNVQCRRWKRNDLSRWMTCRRSTVVVVPQRTCHGWLHIPVDTVPGTVDLVVKYSIDLVWEKREKFGIPLYRIIDFSKINPPIISVDVHVRSFENDVS